ncbi:ABC transporter substrate-binding protein [Bradyrhizobium sp. 2TAF24]|uniref:ABC transporter substrate-binding protein n=1 Tax=Bradyrhizobium sp. 2TAF24 TaxID=3233011 RepID=UPI003F8EA78B
MAVNPGTVWYTRCPVPSPLGIAVRLGWVEELFARENIAVQSIVDSKDRNVRESHFNHHLAWSFRQGGSIPPLRARSEGRATRLVALTWTDEFQAVVTLPGSRIETTKDLVGRRFGVARRPADIVDFHRATALKGLVSALSLEGLAARDVEIVEIPTNESVIVPVGDPRLFGLRRRLTYSHEVAALLRGEVDAIYVKGAEGVSLANLFGLRVVSEFGFHPDPRIRVNTGTPRTLTVDDTFLRERPDLVRGLLGEVVRAGEWAANHADETVRIIAQEVLTSEEAVLAAHGRDVHRTLGITLDAPFVDAIESFKDFLFEWGFLEANFSVRDWVAAEPLADVGLSRAA